MPMLFQLINFNIYFRDYRYHVTSKIKRFFYKTYSNLYETLLKNQFFWHVNWNEFIFLMKFPTQFTDNGHLLFFFRVMNSDMLSIKNVENIISRCNCISQYQFFHTLYKKNSLSGSKKKIKNKTAETRDFYSYCSSKDWEK